MKQKKKLLWQLPLIILVTVLLCCTTSNAQTVPQIAEKALAATVSLEMQDRNGAVLGFGSGFFVRDNLIATNYHVIEGAASGTAKLVDKNRAYTIEGFTAVDKTNDLALLKVTAYGTRLDEGYYIWDSSQSQLLKVTAYGVKPLLLGDSNTVRIGETVYVAGNPIGLEGTVSDGIISGRRDRYTKERLQMTAPISPGSSGGPVLNRKGQVIGVSVSGYHGLGVQNLNFAIPSNYLKALINRSGMVKPFSQTSQSISADTYFLRGNVKIRLEDYQGAIADYTRALHLKPDYANAYYLRGLAKVKLGQYFAAIADCDSAIRLKPDYADAYVSRGLAKTQLGQHFAAIADYDTAIHLRPDYANAYVSRGLAKAQLGQHFAAIADYDTAIRLKPDYADAYYARGLAKAQLGQHFAAIADYDTAIRLKPDYADAYYTRGLEKALLERFWEAKQDLRTALKLAIKDGNYSLKASIEETLKIIDR